MLTAAWVIGGLGHFCWCEYYKGEKDVVMLVASGLMLGEGGMELVSIPFTLLLRFISG